MRDVEMYKHGIIRMFDFNLEVGGKKREETFNETHKMDLR
jgi:hypothetical protein